MIKYDSWTKWVEPMSEVERMTVTLTAEMAEAVRDAVKAGDYASSSEIIREALRDWQHNRALRKRQLEELRTDVRKGLDDIEAGRLRDFDPDRIIAKGRKLSADRAGSS